MAETERVATTVPLDWNEVWFTNCPMVSANNVDQELGWCREEFKKIGVEYAYFRHAPENNWYPHYIHNLDNLIRMGGLYPPIHVNADLRRTVLLGATWVYEGGCMAVRARDQIFKMSDLKGKKIGISKSLNTIKNDWWRIQEHMGILNMLKLNDMTMDDIELVEFPYPDDWYDKPEMLQRRMNNPSELWMRRDHKHDLAFRPLETALLGGKVDAIYTQSKVFQHLQEATGKIKMIEDLSKYPDWTIQVANTPAVITCTDVMADEHPELVDGLHEGDDQGRPLGQREQARRRRDPQPADVLPRRRGHLPGHQGRRHGAQPERAEPGVRQDRQGLHVRARLHQARLRRGRVGAAGVPREGGRGSAQGGVGAPELEQAAPGRRASRSRACGSGRADGRRAVRGSPCRGPRAICRPDGIARRNDDDSVR